MTKKQSGEVGLIPSSPIFSKGGLALNKFGNPIIAYRLFNIQSWDNSNTMIKLETDKANVIIGRNETGKSVLFKVFRQMCFPNFYGKKGRRSLIRRGCDYGILLLALANGTIIRFTMYPTYQVYSIKNTSDKDYRNFKCNELPEELREELGWYIDTQNQILLNIIDNEQGLAFVDTPSKFNAGILKFITEDPQLEQYLQNMKENKTQLENIKVDLVGRRDLVQSALTSTPQQDTFSMESLKSKLEIAEKVYPSLNMMTHLTEEVLKIKKPYLPYPTSLDSHEVLYNQMAQITLLLHQMTSLKGPTPKQYRVEEISNHINHLRGLTAVQEKVQELKSINPPKCLTTNYDTVKTNLRNFQEVQNTLVRLKQLKDLQDKIHRVTEGLTSVQETLNRDFKVCPLCGQLQEDGEVIHKHE